MLLMLLLACAAPDAPHHGTWTVRWDRSGTGWSPTHFNGTLVLEPDHVSAAFHETAGTPALSVYEVTGDLVQISWVWTYDNAAPGQTDLRFRVEGDRLDGDMRAEGPNGTLDWAPFRGLRVKRLEAAP